MSGEAKKSCSQKPNEVAAIRGPLPNHLGQNGYSATPKWTHHTAEEVATECKAQKQAIEEKI